MIGCLPNLSEGNFARLPKMPTPDRHALHDRYESMLADFVDPLYEAANLEELIEAGAVASRTKIDSSAAP